MSAAEDILLRLGIVLKAKNAARKAYLQRPPGLSATELEDLHEKWEAANRVFSEYLTEVGEFVLAMADESPPPKPKFVLEERMRPKLYRGQPRS